MITLYCGVNLWTCLSLRVACLYRGEFYWVILYGQMWVNLCCNYLLLSTYNWMWSHDLMRIVTCIEESNDTEIIYLMCDQVNSKYFINTSIEKTWALKGKRDTYRRGISKATILQSSNYIMCGTTFFFLLSHTLSTLHVLCRIKRKCWK